jgi:uncharacterized protein
MVVLLLVVAAYLVVADVAATRLTVPARHAATGRTPAEAGGTFEAITLRSADDAVDLAAWLLPVDGSGVGVVLVHGIDASRSVAFGGGMIDLAVALQDAGYQVVMVDLRGHGDSGGGHYTFGLKERYDVIAAVDHLVRARGVRPGHVGVLGVSLGAAAAIFAAEVDGRIGAVWSDSSYAEVYPIVVQTVTFAGGLPTFFLPGMRLMYRLRFGFDLVSARPAATVAALEPMPLMIVHGEADRLVPIAHARLLAQAAPWADTWTVEGAEHNEAFENAPGLYTLRVLEFFDLAFRTGVAERPGGGDDPSESPRPASLPDRTPRGATIAGRAS